VETVSCEADAPALTPASVGSFSAVPPVGVDGGRVVCDDEAAGYPEGANRMTPQASLAPMLTIDALGRKCPIPIIMLAERIAEVPVGAVIAVLADDPAAKTDLPAWCGMKSQEFVSVSGYGQGWAFFVRRSY
jgi:tRNA 2-thiouridine synthesizing protein A